MSEHEDRIEHQLWLVIERLDEIIELLTPPPQPATIVLTIEGVPVSSVALSGTQTVEVAVAVGDANGNILTGDVLDAGATVTVADSAVCTAVLSADQTSILVTNLNVDGTTTVVVNGTSGGVTLTDFEGGLTVNSTSVVVVVPPATVVLTPGTPQGS